MAKKTETETKPKPIKKGLLIKVPFLATEKYAQREVHMTLSRDHATSLRAIYEGLETEQAKLANGRPVVSPQDAMRWLLEQAASAAAA
jgi:hypothetical protein